MKTCARFTVVWVSLGARRQIYRTGGHADKRQFTLPSNRRGAMIAACQ